MSSPSLSSLFVRWEAALDGGHELLPEELAPGRPELLGPLREGIAALKRMRQLRPTAPLEAPTVPPAAPHEPATATPRSCPGPGVLARRLAEALDGAERSLVDAHVEGCQPCQAELQRLVQGPDGEKTTAPGDGLIQRLKQRPLISRASGLPGPRLDGQGDAPPGYEVLGELGRGGMGVVYRARQVGLNRVVALKVILGGGHAGEQERARFLLEGEAIAKVKHPGIVQVYDYGTHDGLPYFSLELCEGGSLADKLRDGPLPPREAARMVEQVARAVQAAHEAGIVHRDLKPANVLLTEKGEPRVTDFGLAKKTEGGGQTQTGAVMGTPSYMAPEQAEGKKDVGPPADVWALGAILYACLTGRPPFQAATTLDIIFQVLADDPVPVRRLNPTVPGDLETICHKCLSKEPPRRYGSAAEMAADLGRWLRGEPITARPVGRLERLWSWCRREPVTASLVGAVALLLVAGAAVAWGLAAWALGEKGRADGEALQKRREAGLKEKEALAARQAEKLAKEKEALAREREEAANFQASRAEDARHAVLANLALQAWEGHDVVQAEEALAQVIPRYREAWETRHLRRLCRRKALALVGAGGGARDAAISPDGRLVASSAGGAWFRLWDARTGLPRLSLKGAVGSLEGGATAVAFSPDGKLVAGAVSNFLGGEITVWAADTGRVVRAIKEDRAPFRCLAFSPDGRRIASVCAFAVVKVWGAQTGAELLALKGHETPVYSVAFSPDGKFIASGGGELGGEVRLWEAATGRQARVLTRHRTFVACVAFSPDGKRIASGGGDPFRTGRSAELKVCEAETGKEVFALKAQPEAIRSVAFSPDGRHLLCGTEDGTVAARDARSGHRLFTLKGHTAPVFSVGHSADGKRAVSAGGGAVRVWDTQARQEELSPRGHASHVRGVAFSPDGKFVASAGEDRTVRVWGAASGREALVFSGHSFGAFAVAFSPDGKSVASGGGNSVRVWDARTGKERLAIRGLTARANALCFSPDGRRIALASGDATARLYDARSGKEALALKGHVGGVNGVAFSPDGKLVVTGGDDRSLKVWGAEKGELVLTIKGLSSAVTAVAFSPDSKRVASASGKGGLGEVKVWDARAGREQLSFSGHKETARGVAFSSDGARIVSGGGRTVLVWDAWTGQQKLSLRGHRHLVHCVAFSPDGSRIASGAGDGLQPGELKIWAAEPRAVR